VWRRRESNGGPVSIAENVGAIGSAVSGEESGPCGDAGGVVNASDDAGTPRACSNVASRPTLAALLEAIDDTIAALDADEIDAARARLRALAEVIRATCHVADQRGV
jgi:hypothetical protein